MLTIEDAITMEINAPKARQRIIRKRLRHRKKASQCDYKKNAWRKRKKTVGEALDKPSFCDALNLDFATLL